MRTRLDIAGLTLGDAGAAERQPWHPILETYARGVGLMRDLDPQVTADSWMWAANTHGIRAGTQPRPTWGQCAHSLRTFLPWHRAYLAWFEETIRRLTGEADWALPYWDYSRSDSNRELPVEFTVQKRQVDGQLVTNPLFAPDRSPRPLRLTTGSIIKALSEPRFLRPVPEVGFGGADRDGFAGLAEQRPHNYVHNNIAGLMKSRSTAGRDPIFWLHHATVDRLWEIWRSMPDSVELTDPGGGSLSMVTEWKSATFWFGSEAAPRTYRMANIEDLGNPDMNYQYESLALETAIADEIAIARAVAAGGGFALDEIESAWRPVAATFGLVSGEVREIQFDRRQLALDDATPTRLIVELAGTRATNPHSAYVVEVRSSAEADPHVVDGFSTFGLEGTPATVETNYLVDASAVLPALVGEGWSGGELVVRVVPDPEADDSDDPDRAIRVRQVTVYTQT